jgi:cytochrome c oxidase subunit 2
MFAPSQPATFQLPEQMSTSAEHVDSLYYFIYWLSVVMFVGIIAAMCWFAYKYRRRKGEEAEPTGHNMVLEVAWTVAPIVVLVLLFHWGFKGYMDLSVAPANAMEVRVNAKQWGWEFVYPNGASDNELHVPVHQPVKLIMSSTDVLHAFYAPALRAKRDVVPGMFTSMWFEATHTGDDDIFCAEYCGGRSKDPEGKELAFEQMTGHWSMHSVLHVQTQEEFDKYLQKIGDPCPPAPEPCPENTLVAKGQSLYNKKGCVACHSVTGARLVGPAWNGIFGKEEATNAGPAKVDENYLRESILEPQAKVVAGFSPTMPTFKGQIKDAEIDAIIAYIKSLK